MADTVRTFIALEVPESVKGEIQGAQDKLASVRGARVAWTRPEGVHLTLAFLGDVERERLKDVCDAVRRSAGRAVPLKLTTTRQGAFPGFRRPRVYWLGVDGGAELLKLQQDVERSLGEIGFEGERRSFHPHLTVARVKAMQRDCSLSEEFSGYDFPQRSWEVRDIRVMSSDLKPTGATYGVIASFLLGSGEEIEQSL